MDYPIPTLEDVLTTIAHVKPKFFSSGDMSSAFFQIPILEKDRHITAFVVPSEKYEFKRVSFGIKNSPNHFTFVMSQIFRTMIRERKILIYADDIAFISQTFDDHLEILE